MVRFLFYSFLHFVGGGDELVAVLRKASPHTEGEEWEEEGWGLHSARF